MRIIFWASVGLLIYAYALYPCILWLVAKLWRREHKTDPDYLPKVSLIIPAYNEESVIEEKLDNSLSLDYPVESLEVIVSSDGSTDQTVAIASKSAGDRVRVNDFRHRSGKMGVLNRTVPEAEGEIVVLTDANSIFRRDAVRKLVQHFADGEVACVCGVKTIVEDHRSELGECEGWYWRFENYLKEKESEFGSCVGADGSIYALRKEYYPFPRTDRVIMDDFAVSLKVIESGRRAVFEKEALAYEASSSSLPGEFRRKARILAGALVSLTSARSLLLPWRSPVAWQLLSHKVLRWLGPLLMSSAFLANIFLGGLFYRSMLALQILFYLSAAAGAVLGARGIRSGPLRIPCHFVLANAAQAFGFLNHLRKRYRPAWERIDRAGLSVGGGGL